MYICKVCSKNFKPKSLRNKNFFCSLSCFHKNTKGKARKSIRMSWGYRYLFLPNHPDSSKQGYIAEHRLIGEQKLNRRLFKKEVVHHIDGNRENNNPENLVVCSRREHNEHHEVLKYLHTPRIQAKAKKELRNYHKRKLINWNCLNCNKVKKKSPFQANYRKFCSKKCNYIYRKKHWSNQFNKDFHMQSNDSKNEENL